MNLTTIYLFIFLSIFHQTHGNFTGQLDLVTTLPGLNPNITTLPYRHYSGYLNVSNDTHLFYWFFESQSKPETDPLVLWLSGGPGCSSLFSTLLETGPLHIELNGTLSPNPYAWNTNANLLFIESPAGVGFSYKSNISSYTSYYEINDNGTALLNFEALQQFYNKFPQYLINDFYLTGESYAGIYLSTLATLLLDNHFPKHFKALSLGNPTLNGDYNYHSRVQFALQHGLLNPNLWSSLLQSCNCPNTTTSIRDCTFESFNASTIQVKPSGCSNHYFSALVSLYDDQFSRYNYKQKCTNQSQLFICSSVIEAALDAWLNRADVQKALHVSYWWSEELHTTRVEWTLCKRFYEYKKTIKAVHGYIQKILENGIKVLLYYGDLDLICSYISGQWFIADLNVTAVNTNPSLWKFDNQTAATIQHYREGLVYVKVKDAGHEVPVDKPAFTKQMFDRFLSLDLFNVTEMM